MKDIPDPVFAGGAWTLHHAGGYRPYQKRGAADRDHRGAS